MHASDEGEPAPVPAPAEPVAGTTRTVRAVEALPDGRRVTWYAAALPAAPPAAPPAGDGA